MDLIVNITNILSVVIAIGFMIILYHKYLKNKREKFPYQQNEDSNVKYSECPDFFESTTNYKNENVCENILQKSLN